MDNGASRFAFIKSDYPDYPGKVGVAIVELQPDTTIGVLVDFAMFDNHALAGPFMAKHGIAKMTPAPISTGKAGG